MDTQRFKVFRNGDIVDSLLVPDWINGIQNKQSPDRLSIFGEKHFSASIGGKRLDLETIYGGSEEVPLFEFRDLKHRTPREFQNFLVEVERGIIQYSQQHSDSAKRLRARPERCFSTLKVHPDAQSKGPTAKHFSEPHHLSCYSFADPDYVHDKSHCECLGYGKYELHPHRPEVCPWMPSVLCRYPTSPSYASALCGPLGTRTRA